MPAPAAGFFSVSLASGSGCRCKDRRPTRPALVMAHLPDVAPGTALSIQCGDRTIWERKAPRRPVQVNPPSIERAAGVLAVTWTARWPRSAGDRQVWLRLSTDGCRTWRAVATGVTESHAPLDPAQLPAGQFLLQLVAHNGFFSAHSAPTALDNETLPPILAILHPHPRRPLIAGETLHLWGSAAGQGASPSAAARFRLDDRRRAGGRRLASLYKRASTRHSQFWKAAWKSDPASGVNSVE